MCCHVMRTSFAAGKGDRESVGCVSVGVDEESSCHVALSCFELCLVTPFENWYVV
jgi:hypothetical protein